MKEEFMTLEDIRPPVVVHCQPAQFFDFPIGEEVRSTVLRPLAGMNFEICRDGEDKLAYARFVLHDAFGPTSYLAMSIDEAGDLLGKISATLKELSSRL